MIYILTKKNVSLSEQANQEINNELRKIDNLFPYVNLDFPLMKVNIAKSGKLYKATLGVLLYGQILNTHFQSETPSQAIHLGFERLIRKIKKYKDLHFKSRSEYPNHDSIRRGRITMDENANINVIL